MTEPGTSTNRAALFGALVVMTLLVGACGSTALRAVEAAGSPVTGTVPAATEADGHGAIAGAWTVTLPTCDLTICETTHTVDFGPSGAATFHTMTDAGALTVGPTVTAECAGHRLDGARDHVTVTPTEAATLDLVGVGSFTGTVEEAQVVTVDGEPTCLDVYGTATDSNRSGGAPLVWHLWTDGDGTATVELTYPG